MCIIFSGRTTIGTVSAREPQDIVISGTGVQGEHCVIVNDGREVQIHPIAILCSVDGRQVNNPTKLNQGKPFLSTQAVRPDLV